MVMPIQNRSVLYKTAEPVLVPEGVYEGSSQNSENKAR